MNAETAAASAERDEIRTHTLAAVGALLSRRDEVIPQLLLTILNSHGRTGVGYASFILCTASAGPFQHNCQWVGNVRLLVDEAHGRPELQEAVSIAQDLLTGITCGDGTRYANTLKRLHEATSTAQLEVLTLLVQHVAAVVERMQDVSGDAFAAFDKLITVENSVRGTIVPNK